MYVENEVEPGALQVGVHYICTLQECQITKAESKHPQLSEIHTFGVCAGDMSVEGWVRALQARPRFQTVQIML